jgi:hypothetical protein
MTVSTEISPFTLQNIGIHDEIISKEYKKILFKKYSMEVICKICILKLSVKTYFNRAWEGNM